MDMITNRRRIIEHLSTLRRALAFRVKLRVFEYSDNIVRRVEIPAVILPFIENVVSSIFHYCHMNTVPNIASFVIPLPAHFMPRKNPFSTSRTRAMTGNAPKDSEAVKDIDIAAVGNVCVDIMLPITEYPIIRGEHQLLKRGARLDLGGSMNTLISAKRFGASVAPVAYISTDDAQPSDVFISGFVRDTAKRLGIETMGLVPRVGSSIPTCAALLSPEGDHTFLASNELPDTETYSDCGASKVMLDTVARSKSLIVDGYAFHSDRSLVSDSVNIALSHGTNIWLDPQAATASLLHAKNTLFSSVLRSSYGISLTMAEALLITNTASPSDAISILEKEYCPAAKMILLKDGANGSHIACRENGNKSFNVIHVPGFCISESEFRDSIGAGDSFLGAFMTGTMLLGLSVEESGLLANAMGASTCMKHGAGESGIGTRDRVAQLLSNLPISSKIGIRVPLPG